ncbi:hypothetical protein GGF50DRAFT_118832 [Schizophyllum commune]
MPSFIQPRTIHIHEHEIISPDDWPEEVGVLVKALKLRADDSAFPAIPPTGTPEREEADVQALSVDGRLLPELVVSARAVSRNLALLDRLRQSHVSHAITWPYVRTLLATIWPDAQPNYGTNFVIPIDPCHFDDATARFIPPYMRADALLTTRVTVPARVDAVPAEPPGTTTPPLGDDPQRDDSSYLPTQPDEGIYDDVSMRDASSERSARMSEASGRARASNEPLGHGLWRSDDSYASSYAMSEDLFDRCTEESSGDSPGQTGLDDVVDEKDEECERERSATNISELLQQLHEERLRQERTPSDSDSYTGDYGGQDDGQSYDDNGECDDDGDPAVQHMQIFPHSGSSAVDLAILCASSPQKLYYEMASALLQRRAIDILEAMVGIVWVPGTSLLQFALGWTDMSTTVGCPQVHIAIGTAAARPSRGLATFDMRVPDEALQLACCLATLRDLTDDIGRRAVQHLSDLASQDPRLRWRLDLAGRQLSDPHVAAVRSHIEAWRAAVARHPSQSDQLEQSIRKANHPSSPTAASCSHATTIIATDAALASAPSASPVSSTSMSQHRLKASSANQSTSTWRSQDIPTLVLKNNVVDFQDRALRQPGLKPLLVAGASQPYSASKFAGLAGQVRLRGLSPLQVMCASRGIIETFYPRSQTEVDMFPHLKTLVPYLSFFAPVKLPETLPSVEIDDDDPEANLPFVSLFVGHAVTRIFMPSMVKDISTVIQTIRSYNHYVDCHEEVVRATDAGDFPCEAPLLDPDTKLRLQRKIITSLSTLSSITSTALALDWNAILEAEGRMACWDPMHEKFMRIILREVMKKLENSDAYNLVFRAEHQVRLPRNVALDIDDEQLRDWTAERVTRAALKISEVLTEAQADAHRAVVELREQKAQAERHVSLTEVFTTAATTSDPKDPVHYDPKSGLGWPDSKDTTQAVVDEEAAPRPPLFDKIFDATPNDSTEVNFSMVHDIELKISEDEIIIIYVGEYKRWEKRITAQCVGQAFMDLQAAVYKLASHGIYHCPVFAVATDGPVGIVYTAWGVELSDAEVKPKTGPSVYIYIASQNAPRFDLRVTNQAIQFAMFLLHLRYVHAPAVAKLFEERRTKIINRLEQNDPTLCWTLEQQRTDLAQALKALKERQAAALGILKKQGQQSSTSTDRVGGDGATGSQTGQRSSRASSAVASSTNASPSLGSELAATRSGRTTRSARAPSVVPLAPPVGRSNSRASSSQPAGAGRDRAPSRTAAGSSSRGRSSSKVPKGSTVG